VLLLREVAGMSAIEAATALDLSTANVRTTHHRARATLKAHGADRLATSCPPRPSTARLFAHVIAALRENDVDEMCALLTYRAPSREAARDVGAAA
jgi:RNA polymerase sigma-70 factor, ECF subfamily